LHGRVFEERLELDGLLGGVFVSVRDPSLLAREGGTQSSTGDGAKAASYGNHYAYSGRPTWQAVLFGELADLVDARGIGGFAGSWIIFAAFSSSTTFWSRGRAAVRAFVVQLSKGGRRCHASRRLDG